jgi:predicted GIY-YIG superfamily endonuclease
MPFWLYILRCSDGSYYVGHTDNVTARVAVHNAGRGASYTAARLPVAAVYTEGFNTRQEAVARERQLKRWSRAKKRALIEGDQKRLRELSQSQGR